MNDNPYAAPQTMEERKPFPWIVVWIVIGLLTVIWEAICFLALSVMALRGIGTHPNLDGIALALAPSVLWVCITAIRQQLQRWRVPGGQ